MNTCYCTKKNVKPWTPEQKNVLRQITEYGVRHAPKFMRCYADTSGTVAHRATEQGYDWKQLYNLEALLIEAYEENNEERRQEMLRVFMKNWLQLLQQFYPECDLDSYKEFCAEVVSKFPELQTAKLTSE